MTFFFVAGLATGADSTFVCSSCGSGAVSLARVVLVVGLVARVAFATGFSLASELTVVAVALVERVARFGFSAIFSTGCAVSCSVVVSDFLGRPRGLAAVVFDVEVAGSS